MAYNTWEYRLGELLKPFPTLRQFGKLSYQMLNYYLLRGWKFSHDVTHGCYLMTPEAWAGIDNLTNEHFFGYYDKSPWSTDGRYFLLHCQLSRKRLDPVQLIALDKQNNRILSLGKTQAWNVQQGSMLQWYENNSDPLVVFNDFEEQKLCARIVDLAGREVIRLPLPIQTIHSATNSAISINCNRLLENRLDYAYSRSATNQIGNADHDGIIQMDLSTGDSKLLVPLSWFLQNNPRKDMAQARHWLNHVMYSASGNDLIFMHRWGNNIRRKSRLYHLNLSQTVPRLLIDCDMISHYSWIDDKRIIAYHHGGSGDGYYIIEIESKEESRIQNPEFQSLGDGHPAVSRHLGLVVTDTYPGRNGIQKLAVFDPDRPHEKLFLLGKFTHSPSFHGTARCDLHPRWHPNLPQIAFDSVMNGRRCCWIIDCQEALDFS